MPRERRKVYFATDLDGNALRTCFHKLLDRYDEAISHEEAEFIVFDLHHLPEGYHTCMPEERKHYIEVDLDHHKLPCFLVQLPPSARPDCGHDTAHEGSTAAASKAEQRSGGVSETKQAAPKRKYGPRRRGIKNDVKKLKQECERVFEVEKICRNCDELLREMVWFENMIPLRRKRTCQGEEQVVPLTICMLKQNDAKKTLE